VQVEQVSRRLREPLGAYVLGAEGWRCRDGEPHVLREIPFPGIPLILNLGAPWSIADPGARADRRDSFVAGLHTAPTLVAAPASWECLELRVTPLGARRLLGVPMHELANRTVALEDVLPGTGELVERLRERTTWPARFSLLEAFLERRLGDSPPPSGEIAWTWHRLRRSGGRAPIGELVAELGWSHRRLIARFREQIGLAPKAVARVFRFDRAVAALASRPPAEVARECGYFDQAHLNRDFRELAGTTPAAFVKSFQDGAPGRI
jgi:AraC-like DNA-binding protein